MLIDCPIGKAYIAQTQSPVKIPSSCKLSDPLLKQCFREGPGPLNRDALVGGREVRKTWTLQGLRKEVQENRGEEKNLMKNEHGSFQFVAGKRLDGF